MSKRLTYLVSFVLALSLINCASAELIGHWKFDGDMNDSVVNNDGTANGDVFAGTSNGVLGGAAEFDGAGDSIVIPTPSLPGTSWSLTWWSFTPADSTNTGYMVASGNPSGYEAVFFRRYGPEIFAGGVTQDTNVTPRISLGEPGPYPRGQWHHHAVLHDGSSSTAFWYINGILWIDTNLDDTNATTFTSFDEVIYAGNRKSGGRDFEGKIDDLRLYDEVLTAERIQIIMLGGGTTYPFAYGPEPADGDLLTDTWTNLGWRPGDFAVSHDVYFGDNFNDVNAGAESTFQGNQVPTFLVAGFPGFVYPDGLVPGTTYYWRIDEVNDTEPNSPWKGPVWSFSIPPKIAYFPDPANGATFVDTEGDLSWTPGFGAKLHTVYFGDNFEEVNNATGGQTQGTATYTPGTLKMAKTYYWRVDEFDASDTFKGEVWSFITQGAVESLNPANGVVDVTQAPILTWTPGIYGASHEVYFGIDKEAVKNADTSSPEYKGSGSLGSESFEPELLEWNTTYYWRIDEANDTNSDSPWTGPLWSFTTADFLTIDGFESYNDLNEDEPGSNRIYLAWIDGFDNPTINGSIVGYTNPPFAEQTFVHSGNQSMPMAYDNAVGKSEATLTLTSNRDWTIKGVSILTIWFRGDSANAAEQIYVALNGNARIDNDNPDAATTTAWTEWNIDLQAFADQSVNLANVTSITIGLGNRANPTAGGSGMMYFDDIRLYAPEP
ncbi:MAG: LamG domain-containing protein [Planctomycetes bacterium]|nr:LamG domain-containing protein [Planctomycetota bacterium]